MLPGPGIRQAGSTIPGAVGFRRPHPMLERLVLPPWLRFGLALPLLVLNL